MCDEYMKSIDSGVCHKLWSIDRANLFTNQRISGLPIRAKYVKITSLDAENHDKNGYAKMCDDNNIFMTNVDNVTRRTPTSTCATCGTEHV